MRVYIYKWNKAEWTGNTALTAQELDPLLGMQAGKPANGRKLDQALASDSKGLRQERLSSGESEKRS